MPVIHDYDTLEVLPGGKHVIARRPLRQREGCVPAEIVLCYLPHNRVTPWATWQRNTQEFEGTYWGHYFGADEEEKARADFAIRGS